MSIFGFKAKHQELEAQVADMLDQQPDPIPGVEDDRLTKPVMDLLQYNTANVEKILRRLDADKGVLEAVIAAKTEQLRQTRVSIEAFTMALKRLTQ